MVNEREIRSQVWAVSSSEEGGGGEGPCDPGTTADLEDLLAGFGLVDGTNYDMETLQEPLDMADDFDMEVNNPQIEECDQGEGVYDEECLCEIDPYMAYHQFEVDCGEYNIMYWYHPDYLGNTELITDRSGAPYQYFWYSPWGEALVEQHSMQASYSSFFRFNGKELDEETGNYYYGARYYDPKVSVWLSVDPLAHKSPSQTPYHFLSNNPVMRIDPNGLHDYTVDSEGKIALAKETEDDFDMLYSASDYSGDCANGLKVDHVNGETVFKITENEIEGGGHTSSFNIDDDQTANDVYHFLADNSNVEWSRTKYDWNDEYGSGNMIATSHHEGKEHFAGSFINQLKEGGGSALYFSHSHPGDNFLNFHGPSGEHPLDLRKNDGDLDAARDYSKMFPNLKYSIYDVSLGKEIPYDKHGSGWWTRTLKRPAVKIR